MHSVVYHDLNKKLHNEDLYFNMLIPDFADLEFNPTFGDQSLSEYMRDEMGSGNIKKIYVVFKLLVTNSYGRRSEDGERFLKRASFTEEFLNSGAWEQFFIWLIEPGTDNAQKFWEGIFPEETQTIVENLQKTEAEATKDAPAQPAKKSLDQMSAEEMRAILAKSAANN
jgi:hypothetical protein